MAGISGKQLADAPSGISTSKLNDGVLSADTAGRAKIANNFFDATTFAAKVPTGAVALDRLAAPVIRPDGSVAFTSAQSMGNQKLTNVGAPADPGDGANKGYVDSKAAPPTSANKAQTPAATTGNEATTGLTIAATPVSDGHVDVRINGIGYELGDAVKTKDCYFSVDGGTTARAIAAITAGDTLYWNGTIVGFDLATSDKVSMHYNA